MAAGAIRPRPRVLDKPTGNVTDKHGKVLPHHGPQITQCPVPACNTKSWQARHELRNESYLVSNVIVGFSPNKSDLEAPAAIDPPHLQRRHVKDEMIGRRVHRLVRLHERSPRAAQQQEVILPQGLSRFALPIEATQQ